ncbi:MAG: hypothetical protein Q9166_005245 [cf. Caloplaca sp. 2 TL-2023]
MTVWKQRFYRWNYFFVTGMYYDLTYILFDWKLGWWEIGAKIFVFQEVYETLLYLLAPFVIPISFATRPIFSSYLYAAVIVMYIVNALLFNYRHPKVVEDDRAVEIVLNLEQRETWMSEKGEIEDLNELMYKIAKPVVGGDKRKRSVVSVGVNWGRA